MKTSILCLLSLSFLGSLSAEDGPVCHKCEKIREYNASHPENNYYWYDDYVKEKKESKEHPVPKDSHSDSEKVHN